MSDGGGRPSVQISKAHLGGRDDPGTWRGEGIWGKMKSWVTAAVSRSRDTSEAPTSEERAAVSSPTPGERRGRGKQERRRTRSGARAERSAPTQFANLRRVRYVSRIFTASSAWLAMRERAHFTVVTTSYSAVTTTAVNRVLTSAGTTPVTPCVYIRGTSWGRAWRVTGNASVASSINHALCRYSSEPHSRYPDT